MTETMQQAERRRNGEQERSTARAGEPGRMDTAMALLRAEVDARVGSGAAFADREQCLLRVANEAICGVQARELQELADRFNECEEVVVEGALYRKHRDGTVAYHGLCGSMSAYRWTFRAVGVHNGPTIVPLELAAGLVERATPALAAALLSGYGAKPPREVERSMHADFREPPSRRATDRIVKQAGSHLREVLPSIEPVIRAEESLPVGTKAVSVGLDRTSTPMEEPLGTNRDVDHSKRRKKKRIKPYQRTPPAPIEVNYRMAYVGTVSFVDVDGRALRTIRYSASAEEGPAGIVESMMRDLLHARRVDPALPIAVIQDAAPELWNLVRRAMAKHGLTPTAEMIDRYHLNERLAKVLRATRRTEPWREEKMREWNAMLDEDDDAIEAITAWVRDTRERAAPKVCEQLYDELTYLENNKDRMRYASHRRAGLPVGSGPTEGACKSVVGVRACGSGQRWHTTGLDSVLTLRALLLSERLPGSIELLRRDHYTAEIRKAA